MLDAIFILPTDVTKREQVAQPRLLDLLTH